MPSLLSIAPLAVSCLFASASAGHAQDLSTGSINITVQDAAGAVVDGAQVVIKNLGTNDVHTVPTKGAGTATVPFLNPAQYSVTVSREGFDTAVYPVVTVQTNQVTNLNVQLAVGQSTQSVSVSAQNSPLLQTTDNTLSTTIDLKQVEDLPLQGRDVFSLAFLVPGALAPQGGLAGNINNLPGGAVNVSSNGFSTVANRNKSGGFDTAGSSTVNRIEDVQEMTVQAGELDASKGGTSVMDIAFVTRSGTNQFHGRLFEDYRNDALNSNSWYNNFVGQRRSKEIINDFGASIGGPILKNKAFFFASLANFREPLTYTGTAVVATPAALAGNYTYVPTGSTATKTVNVLQAGASAVGCGNCSGTVNPIIAGDLANIASTYSMAGVTQSTLDLNHNTLEFPVHESIAQRYPTLRLDYNVTPDFRLTGSVNESNAYYTNAGAPPFPGPLYSNQAYSNAGRNYQAVAGFDWNIRPTLVNAFRVGYLYTGFLYNTQGVDTPTAAMTEQGQLAFGFGLTSGVNGFNSLRGGSLYPVLSVKDDSTWVHGRHNISFGVSSATEIDHYYNNQFVPYIGVDGISTGDPVTDALTTPVADGPTSAVSDVEGLYATLTGRMTYYSLGQFVNAQTKQFSPGVSFNLHERLNQTALFVEDAWRATPSLTINVGLRWDFTGASKDETGFYTHPTVAALWGPSGVGNIFKPGTLSGEQNPVEGPGSEAYAPTYVHPEPNFGIAWNPHGSDGPLGRILGDGKSVIRASYTFKNYTEGAQNFWNFGSNSGANFNTYFYADPTAPVAGVTPSAGLFNAGSVILGGPLPALASTSPSPFQSTITEASQAFSGTSFLTFDPHIQQPYVESWSLGVQRELNASDVLEVRYVGNVARKQWLPQNYNEVNIFENGFLGDFKNAQANLAASGGTTFQGTLPTPILNQAFANAGGASNYTNGQFITYLQQGQAGAFATALAGNAAYLCSLVGAGFAPCATAGYIGGGSAPSNFFQENPFATGQSTLEMTNAGFSNYNSLQLDFRQRPMHGAQFDANYTLSKSLGTSVQGSTAPGLYGGRSGSAPGFFTLRNKALNYFPSTFDVRNVFHLSGTYDLPFGQGRTFLHDSKLANSTIGGWTLGAIVTYQSGYPFLFSGGTSTFNQNDSGIALTGVTVAQLQKQVRVRHVAGSPWVSYFDPKYIGANGQANPAYISPQQTPGQIGTLMWLHAPKWTNTDLSVSKTVPIHHEINLKLQGEFLNAFNHTAWTGMTTNGTATNSVQATTFGTTNTTANSPRNVELRANIQF
ncbi:TonB-dependent receptor [Acidipila sp. EB88]|uniref:TonB-dependent receptor n=1 Tax=Acidipila sp. EB88 TaxID=2305226 RepID=UPI000F5EEE0A|nr:TonB-dependent receptor [Acidipila sp. EB88]RRA50218.1 TonB-dependent receptor [Acidipila sp. EB88]